VNKPAPGTANKKNMANRGTVHVQVPGGWSVERGHQVAGRIASEIRQALPEAAVSTHLEPLEEGTLEIGKSERRN
jgi:divalent metal cation (Fe/Co/Zn/Cd) transporter